MSKVKWGKKVSFPHTQHLEGVWADVQGKKKKRERERERNRGVMV